jgi:hypothetical protein
MRAVTGDCLTAAIVRRQFCLQIGDSLVNVALYEKSKLALSQNAGNHTRSGLLGPEQSDQIPLRHSAG